MKSIRSALIALAIVSAGMVSTVAAAQSQTFATSGTFNGRQYTSMTVTNNGNGTYSCTLHFTDGSQFTREISEESYSELLDRFATARNQGGD